MARPDRSLPVAVFDSGVGGLTVLHECLVSIPHEDFLYLGDTARFPYGDRSPDELREFARELAGILLDRGREAARRGLQLGHGGGAARAREELRRRVDVVGVVGPSRGSAAARHANGRVGLLATPATVEAAPTSARSPRRRPSRARRGRLPPSSRR